MVSFWWRASTPRVKGPVSAECSPCDLGQGPVEPTTESQLRHMAEHEAGASFQVADFHSFKLLFFLGGQNGHDGYCTA